MKTVTRRDFSKCLAASVPFASSLGKQDAPGTATTGFLNLHVTGPFLFLYGSTKILILSPQPADHLAPYLTCLTSEADLDLGSVYQLVGPAANSAQPAPTALGGIVSQRLAIPATRVGLDSPVTIDSGHKRYFAFWVPMPVAIVPWHPVSVALSGKDSPFGNPTTVNLPVGLTFIYSNVTFSAVQVNNLTDTSKTWVPKPLPLPGQNVIEIDLPMESSLSKDCHHASAMAAFGTELDLIANIKQKQRLDLAIQYTDDDPTCAGTGELSKHDAGKGKKQPQIFTHPGHDCKSPVVEIDGVSDSLVVG